MKSLTIVLATLCVAAFACPAIGQVSMADDFQADYGGGALPQNNPNGDWTYRGADGVVDLVAEAVSPGGIGDGWNDQDPIIGYARGGPFGLGPGSGDAIVTHVGDDPNLGQAQAGNGAIIDYSVPSTGLFDLTMTLQQAFEAVRNVRYELFQNGGSIGILDSAGQCGPCDGMGNQPVLSNVLSNVNLTAGDTLRVSVIGTDDNGGNGLGTFVGYNLVIAEVPEPTTFTLLGLAGLALLGFRRR